MVLYIKEFFAFMLTSKLNHLEEEFLFVSTGFLHLKFHRIHAYQ